MTSSRRSWPAALTALLLGAALTAPVTLAGSPANAAPGSWLGPTDLAAPAAVSAPTVVTSPNGAGIALWVTGSGAERRITAATRASGYTTWRRAVTISPASGTSTAPSLAVGPGGRAIAVWEHSEGGRRSVQSAEYDPGTKAWSSPVTRSATHSDALTPSVAIGANHRAAIVWTQDGEDTRTVVTSRAPGATSWSTPAPLSEAGRDAERPAVAVGPGSTVTVAWTEPGGDAGTVRTATRPGGGTFAAPVELAVGELVSPVHLALDARGVATALWSASATESAPARVWTAARPRGGSWAPAVALSDASVAVTQPLLAVASGGSAVAAWIADGGLEIVRRTAGQNWGAPQSAATGPVAGASVAAADDATLAVTWAGPASGSTGTTTVQARTWTTGPRVWSEPTTISTAGVPAAAPDVSLARDGAATAVWENRGRDVISAVSSALPRPYAATRPRVVGTERVGSYVTCDADWVHSTARAYAWTRGSSRISGASKYRYKLTASDRGKLVRCRSTAKNSIGTTLSTSKASKIAAGRLQNRTAPRIKGTLAVGRKLTATKGTWTNRDTGARKLPTATYKWYRNGARIAGASAKSYRLTKRDRGRTIQVKATVTSKGYSTATKRSAVSVTVRKRSA